MNPTLLETRPGFQLYRLLLSDGRPLLQCSSIAKTEATGIWKIQLSLPPQYPGRGSKIRVLFKWTVPRLRFVELHWTEAFIVRIGLRGIPYREVARRNGTGGYFGHYTVSATDRTFVFKTQLEATNGTSTLRPRHQTPEDTDRTV